MADFVSFTIKFSWSFIRLCNALMNPTLPLSFYWQSKLATTDPPLPPSQKRILHPPHRVINNDSSCCYMTQISIDTSMEEAGLLWIWSSSTHRAHLLRVTMRPTGRDFWFTPSSLRASNCQSFALSILYFLLFQHQEVGPIFIQSRILFYIKILLWSLSVMTRLILVAIFILNELMTISVATALWRHVWIN